MQILNKVSARVFICLPAGLFVCLFVCLFVWLFVRLVLFVSLVFRFMWLFVRSGGFWLEMAGWGGLGKLRVACCVLRIACCVLRVACCVSRVGCCVLYCLCL